MDELQLLVRWGSLFEVRALDPPQPGGIACIQFFVILFPFEFRGAPMFPEFLAYEVQLLVMIRLRWGLARPH